jgi:hypothetical protein
LYPDVATAASLEVRTLRYDAWQAAVPVGLLPPKMNVLVVDVQGMDLEVGPCGHSSRCD